MSYGFKILAEGRYACFSRPEMKVERVSYDVPTVSALEGMIKQIYWKPAIRIVIDTIVVFHPIRFLNIRRNEVKSKISFSEMKKKQTGNGEPEIYTSEVRTQRASMILRDVKYGIAFHLERTGIRSEHADESDAKHYNIMLRRLQKGQHFQQPCFGCREFPVERLTLVEEFPYEEIDSELKGDIDLGYMLYGLQFQDGGIPLNQNWEHPIFSDSADAIYYRPHLIDGVIDVQKYREGMKC